MSMSFFSSATVFVRGLVNWFWIAVDGTMFHRSIVRILYFPSLLRLSLMQGPHSRWYDRIDSTVIVGALPFRSQTKELVEKENVRAVLSYNEAFELNFFTNNEQEWAKHGVRRAWFSTIDYQPPTLQAINEGLKVIAECKLRNESVYIHCKAGKGRSALVTTCYLIKDHNLSLSAAINFLRSKRPQVKMNPRQKKRVAEFVEQLKRKED